MTGERMRILVVEDEALVAMELLSMLEAAGHLGVGQADDVPSAVDAAEEAHPDLALVDIRLANGASGLDVAAALRSLDVPVVFLTGNCPKDRGMGLALGCLHKPVSDNTLKATLNVAAAVLDGRPVERTPSALHLY